MSKSPVEVWLWLLLVMQPYNPKTNQILSRYGGDATKASIAIRDENLSCLTENEKRRAAETRNGAIMRVLKICEENGISIITLDDGEYPPLLKDIENPPIVLFVKGSLEGLESELVISAVGTKRPSEYSYYAADALIGTLSELGTVFVSGNADGLDSAVHRACIKARGRSIAVLPCGILSDYPKSSSELRGEILKNGGALVSELLPYTKASIGYFHLRNRIISGMSLGTIVLQAGDKSGSLITANYAFFQKREVFYIPPHDIFSKEYGGAAILANQNAIPIFGVSDVLDKLLKNDNAKPAVSQKIIEFKTIKPRPNPPVIKAEPKPQENVKKEAPEIPDNLSAEEKTVAELIAKAPADIDALIDKSGLDYETAVGALTILELSGVITRQMDGNYILSDE